MHFFFLMTSEKIISQKPACKLAVIIVFTHNFKIAVYAPLAGGRGFEPLDRIKPVNSLAICRIQPDSANRP